MEYKIASAGARATSAINPGQTTHLLVKGDKTDSAKVILALDRRLLIHIVSEVWLEECLKAWSVLPEGTAAKLLMMCFLCTWL